MRNFLILIFSAFLLGSIMISCGTVGQLTGSGSSEAKKALSNASRALGAFNLDPRNNTEKIKEAIDEIDTALQDNEIRKTSKVWITQGEIYNAIAQQNSTAKVLTQDFVIQVEKPGLTAYDAFSKGLELAQKSYEKKDCLKGLQQTAGFLSDEGIAQYESGDYEAAFLSFNALLNLHDLLKNNAMASVLETEDDYNNQMYITGLAALNANKETEAKTIFQRLYDENYDKPAIYEALYKIKLQDEPEAAFALLEAGRKKYPDDISLLFAEINHYLRINKLHILIEKLHIAIEKEPENISLYSTMGNVYDNLYQQEHEAGNLRKSAEYFDLAMNYYNQTLAKDVNYFDAIYSIGALYYNRAAFMTKELNALSDDFSIEGLKKFEEKKIGVFQQFNLALPYFKKAESINPNDANTLIALKEIFARKNDLNLSNIFKERLEKVQAGLSNESSYYNK